MPAEMPPGNIDRDFRSPEAPKQAILESAKVTHSLTNFGEPKPPTAHKEIANTFLNFNHTALPFLNEYCRATMLDYTIGPERNNYDAVDKHLTGGLLYDNTDTVDIQLTGGLLVESHTKFADFMKKGKFLEKAMDSILRSPSRETGKETKKDIEELIKREKHDLLKRYPNNMRGAKVELLHRKQKMTQRLLEFMVLMQKTTYEGKPHDRYYFKTLAIGEWERLLVISGVEQAMGIK